jgi:hypothetical protein
LFKILTIKLLSISKVQARRRIAHGILRICFQVAETKATTASSAQAIASLFLGLQMIRFNSTKSIKINLSPLRWQSLILGSQAGDFSEGIRLNSLNAKKIR